MRSYSILLLNNALIDICSATASILATTRHIYLIPIKTDHCYLLLDILRRYRLLFVDGSQLYVYVGACSHVGIWFCHLCQCKPLHSLLRPPRSKLVK